MMITEEVPAIICIILAAEAEIEDNHNIIKNTPGIGAEVEREGGVENLVTQEDADGIKTIYRQEGITTMKVSIYHLTIITLNMRGGEAEVDPSPPDTTVAAITITEMKGSIMTREEESTTHIIILLILIVICIVVLDTLSITKTRGKDHRPLLRDMVNTKSFLNLI